MTRLTSRRSRQCLLGLSLLTMLACGDDDGDNDDSKNDDKNDGKDAGSEAGGSGSAGTGMTRPTGGRGGSGGTGGDPASVYRCDPPRGDVGGPGGIGTTCCGALGVCAANPNGADQPGLPHDTCAAQSDLRCVPVALPEPSDDAGGAAGFDSCRVTFPGAPDGAPSYEGRCQPACFTAGSPLAARLQQSTCKQAELCAPCFNPLDGKDTGSCSYGGDAPSEAAPTPFATCSDDLGYCVPTFAAGTSAAQLSQLTCATGELCAPKIKVADPQACFARCVSSIGVGACVPTFLASGFGTFLTQADCAEGELCAPCEFAGSRTSVCD